MNPDSLKSALASGEFVCSAELVLGRDHALAEARRSGATRVSLETGVAPLVPAPLPA